MCKCVVSSSFEVITENSDRHTDVNDWFMHLINCNVIDGWQFLKRIPTRKCVLLASCFVQTIEIHIGYSMSRVKQCRGRFISHPHLWDWSRCNFASGKKTNSFDSAKIITAKESSSIYSIDRGPVVRQRLRDSPHMQELILYHDCCEWSFRCQWDIVRSFLCHVVPHNHLALQFINDKNMNSENFQFFFASLLKL